MGRRSELDAEKDGEPAAGLDTILHPLPGVGEGVAAVAGGCVKTPPPLPRAAAPVAASPRLSAAEKRLAQEKKWLVDTPSYCFAEPMRASDFVWSFRVSGLHGTAYQVRRCSVSALCVFLDILFTMFWDTLGRVGEGDLMISS